MNLKQRGFYKLGIILGGILTFFFVLIITLYFARNAILSSLIESNLSNQLQASVKISSTNLDIWKRSLTLNGIEIGNPPGFRNQFSFRIPEFKIGMDNPIKIQDRWMISEIVIDINEMLIEINPNGDSNLSKIVRRDTPSSPNTQIKAKSKKAHTNEDQQVKFKIGAIILRVNQVTYYDYRIVSTPPRLSYNVNISETLRDSDSIDEIKQRILLRILSKLPPKILESLDLEKFIQQQKDKLKNTITDKLKKIF